MSLAKTIVMCCALVAIQGCQQSDEYTYIGNLISEDRSRSYEPYADRELMRVCILESGNDLANYVELKGSVPYGYMAIVEYTKSTGKVDYLEEGLVDHKFKLNKGIAYCTDEPGKLMIIPHKDHWLFVLKEK